jgi:hypothetical protein
MAVYAQAPTVQSNPVGTFINAFQAGQNLFERKRRLSMEEERQQREAERLAKAELRAIDTHQKNMRSMEIANETNEFNLNQKREMDDTAATSLKTLVEEMKVLQEEAGTDLNSSSGIPDSQLRQKHLINIQRKTAALQSRFATVFNHPIYGPQAQQYLGNVEQALIPHAEAMAADQAKDVGSFYTELQRIQSLPPQERRQHVYGLKRDYNLLLGSQQHGDRLNNELTAFEKSISDDIAAEKTRKEEQRKETEFTQKQEERTVVKTEERSNAIQDQIKLMREMDRVRRLRNDIAQGDFQAGGWGNIFEWIKGTLKGGSRNAAMAIADEISTGEWLDNVSKLKGALSDKEGARLSVAGLKRSDSEEIWLEKLNNLLDQYQTSKQFMQSEGRWYVDDKGKAVLGGTNPAVSEEEPDFSIFDDPVTNDDVKELLEEN